MSQIRILAAAISAALASPGAFASPCVESSQASGAPLLTCSALNSNPVNDARNDLRVDILVGASVFSNNRNTPPLVMNGNDQQMNNAGSILNSDTRNNTDAIAVYGDRLAVVNQGSIVSGDRAIQVLGGNGGLSVTNLGTIESRRQAIRALEGLENVEVINHGTIESADGRALQLRGDGARVINHGNLLGGEEVVEARGNFFMENYGNIILKAGVSDEDGVQFASGALHNWGLIQGSDDGVDVDEGLVHNYATGRIISTGPDNLHNYAGIDIDAEFDNGVDPIRPAGTVTIINEGLIEGPRAINAASASTSSVNIINSGTLLGRSSTAIDLAPDQGNSSLKITGNSMIYGDVLFGGGDDELIIESLSSAMFGSGVFDGGLGVNRVLFSDYGLTDVLSFVFDGIDTFTLSLNTVAGAATGLFRNFESWQFASGQTFDSFALTSQFSGGGTVPVPVPATLPLLLGALGALWLTGRRREPAGPQNLG